MRRGWSSQGFGGSHRPVPLRRRARRRAVARSTWSEAGRDPGRWVEQQVDGNPLGTNSFASPARALPYFATLTGIPVLQVRLGRGMGQGPALALLLAGPALSLPSLFVLHGVLGTRKTLAYAGLVVLLSTIAGASYGALVAA